MTLRYSEGSEALLKQISNDHFRLRIRNLLADFDTALETADDLNQLHGVRVNTQRILDNLQSSEDWKDHESRMNDPEIAKVLIGKAVEKKAEELREKKK